MQKALATKGWKGVLQAKAPGSDCLQFHVKKLLSIYGKEDCLFLNVYTPVVNRQIDSDGCNRVKKYENFCKYFAKIMRCVVT